MEDENDTRPRVHVDAPLTRGAGIWLSESTFHHLRHVVRCRPGDGIRLFNGRDGEWDASLPRRDDLPAVAGRQLRPQPPPRTSPLILLYAPLRGQALHGTASGATELGVAAIGFLPCERAAGHRADMERLRKITLGAAEQCERLDLPEIRENITPGALAGVWPPDWPLLLCLEREPGRPIAAVACGLPPGPRGLVIGPEGGFSRAEKTVMQEIPGAVTVSLGEEVLRADTAALAAVALVTRGPAWAAP